MSDHRVHFENPKYDGKREVLTFLTLLSIQIYRQLNVRSHRRDNLFTAEMHSCELKLSQRNLLTYLKSLQRWISFIKVHKTENNSWKHENINGKLFLRCSILFWRALITWSQSSLPLTMQIAREKACVGPVRLPPRKEPDEVAGYRTEAKPRRVYKMLDTTRTLVPRRIRGR